MRGLDILDSDLRDTGDRDPSNLPMEAGEADSPDMSRVRLETSALVSDWAEFCLVRPGGWSPALAPLVEKLGWDLGDIARP